MASTQGDSRNLLELAVDIHTDIGKLATGLAHAGAAPEAVKGLQNMAVGIAGIAKILGTGPVGSHGQSGEPPPGPGEPEPAQAAPPAVQEAPATGVRPGERPSALDSATKHLQAAVQASKH